MGASTLEGASRASCSRSAAPPRSSARALAWTRIACAASLVLIVGVSAWYAWGLLVTTFRFQDDEGYFLLAFRAYRAGHALYDEIATIYGPFYFQVVDGLFRLLRVPIDSDTARGFVLVAWIAASLGVSRYAQRATGSVVAGALAYVLAFPLSSSLVSSPLHPGALDLVLASGILLASLGLDDGEKRGPALFVCGALAAALALSKINAGAFAIAAFAVLLARSRPATRAGTAARVVSAVLLVALPFALMARHLSNPDVRAFAALVSASLAPFAFARARRDDSLPIAPFALGAVALGAIVLAHCVAMGSTWSAMARSLVVDALRFPAASFVFEPRVACGVEVLVACAAAVAVFAFPRAPFAPDARSTARSIARLASGVTILALCAFGSASPMRALPLVWMLAVPRDEHSRGIESRTLLGLLAVLEALQGYPIAGNQLVLSAFLLPIAGVVLVWDALATAPSRWREFAMHAPARRRFASIAVVAFASIPLVSSLPSLRKQIESGVRPNLAGASTLRLPERRAAELEWIARNLEQNGETFVGVPGLHSFYAWTGMRPPQAFYPHTWVLFSDGAQQAELARRLLDSDRPCLVRNRAVLAFWTGRREGNGGPMSEIAERDFETAGAVGEFELLLPRGARADLVLSVLGEPAPAAVHERFGVDRVLRLAFPITAGAHVARILVRDTSRGVDVADTVAETNEQRALLVDAHGDELLGLLGGGDRSFIDLSERREIYLVAPASLASLDARCVLARAFDEQGRVIARLLMPTDVRAPQTTSVAKKLTSLELGVGSAELLRAR